MRVQINIDFKNNSDGVLETHETSLPEQINVQRENVVNLTSNDAGGFKGFQLSESRYKKTSKLDGSSKMYFSGYPGFISRQLSRSDLYFESPVELSFNVAGGDITLLYIVFDTVSKEYALDFTVRNDTTGRSVSFTYNKSPRIYINKRELMLRDNDKVTVSITRWSRGFASAKVTRVSSYVIAKFTGSDIIDINCSENLLNAQMNMQPGICEQYIDASIYDRDGLIQYLAENDLLNVDYKISANAIDFNHDVYELGTYTASDWDVPGDSNAIKVTGIDTSYTFNKISMPALPPRTRSVDEMLSSVFSHVPDISWRYIDEETRKYCKDIVTPDNWFPEEVLATRLHKICIVGMLRVYWYIDSFIVARCY